jgi:hypothetical protein
MFRVFERRMADEALQRIDTAVRGGMSKKILHAAISVSDSRRREQRQ